MQHDMNRVRNIATGSRYRVLWRETIMCHRVVDSLAKTNINVDHLQDKAMFLAPLPSAMRAFGGTYSNLQRDSHFLRVL